MKAIHFNSIHLMIKHTINRAQLYNWAFVEKIPAPVLI